MLRSILFRRILPLILSLVTVFSLLQAFSYSALAAPGLPAVNDQAQGTVCTALSGDAQAYYTGRYTYENLRKLNGSTNVSSSENAKKNNPLYSALQELMTNTHTFNTTYKGTGEGSLAYYWQRTDALNGHAGSFMLIYTGWECPINNSSSFNREHVWPKSNASFHESNGGSDLHHLRPANPTVNSTRGNLPFGNVRKGGANYTTGTDGLYWKTGNLFEPRDAVKGDVARILLYVYVRWGENNLYTDTSNGAKIIESLDTLLEWIALDPVDTWEMKRNDLTEDVQGNRNVFIDYPELAFRMFGREVPAGLQTPSGSAVQTCSHNFRLVSTRPATCEAEGSKEYVCTKCGESKSEPIPALGHIDSDADGECDRCGAYIEVSVIVRKTGAITDGAHILFYYPSAKTVLSDNVKETSTGKKNIVPVPAEAVNNVITVPEHAVVFVAREQTEGEFFFVTPDGKYLSTVEEGNNLFYSDQPDEYCLWRTESGSNGEVYIYSVNAAYNGVKNQAIECYSGAFTVYGLKNKSDDKFIYNLYATADHIWDRGETTPVPGTAVHSLYQTCLICGAHRERIIDRMQGDFNLDGQLTIVDVTYLLNMLAAEVKDWTQDDDVDDDGMLTIGDVTALLNALAR